ncbi:protein trichome birefringence-like 6 [Silene latifolia]|uniref:protein trichome birefringence-like 6 n=1 Tax=Silene latifolia TaxID=37657 RepID=UPI003D788572
MEKQKSLSCKSTRFLVLSLTLSFSLVLLSYLFSWAMQASPFIHQEAYFLLNTSSLSFKLTPLNLPSFTAPFTDLPTNTVNNTNLSNTHVKKSQLLPGFVGNNSITVSVNTTSSKSSKVLAYGVKVANLGVTHLRKPQNASGFVGKGKIGKVNDQASKGNFSTSFGNGSGEKLVNFASVSKIDEEMGKKRGKVCDVSMGRCQEGNFTASFGSRGGEKLVNFASVSKVDEGIGKKKRKVCDVSMGRWVFDEKNYPLYTNFSCPFIDEGFNCQGNGRLDKDYMKWRWQPHDCDIPRFNATNMLELIRGKRLVFAGDSINRNQWESLLCLLMGAVKDPRKVYETRGRRITKQRGNYSFRFKDYQCTVEFHVSHFLVRETKAKVGKKRKATLRIDSVDRESAKWRGADILVFNTGNWWSHYKTKAGKNYYQEGNEVYPHLDPITAYKKALATWATWVDKNVNPQKTHIFFRSTAPAHFREGQWNTGGHCREARNPLSEAYVENPAKDIIAEEIISKMRIPVTFLNVSGMSSFRIDGHPSKYGKNIVGTGHSVEDCSHWCLPGVPDAWNELLYYYIRLKQRNNLYAS